MYATQYADDAQPLIKSLDPEVIQRFIDHMDVFRRASGQGLHSSMTHLLILGDTSAYSPIYPDLCGVCGLRVVHQAESLGVAFSNNPAAACKEVWDDLLNRIREAYERISRLGLSVFGRAQAAAAYGVSRILHHVEHLGLPEEVSGGRAPHSH